MSIPQPFYYNHSLNYPYQLNNKEKLFSPHQYNNQSPQHLKILNIPHHLHPQHHNNQQSMHPNKNSQENFELQQFKADRELSYLFKKVSILEEEKTKLLNLQASPNQLPREQSKSQHSIMKVLNINSDHKQYETIKQEINSSHKDKENLLQQIKILLSENENLKKEVKNLQDTKSFMNCEIEKLEKYVKDLLNDNEALQLKYQEKYIDFQKSKLLKSELALALEEIQSKQQEIGLLKEQLNFKQIFNLNEDRFDDLQFDLESLKQETINFIEANKEIELKNKGNVRMVLHLLREEIWKLREKEQKEYLCDQKNDQFDQSEVLDKPEQESADFSGKYEDLSDLNEKCKQIYDMIFQRNQAIEKHDSQLSFSNNFDFHQ